MVCKSCLSDNLITSKLTTGIHFARVDCGYCGLYQKWLSKKSYEESLSQFKFSSDFYDPKVWTDVATYLSLSDRDLLNTAFRCCILNDRVFLVTRSVPLVKQFLAKIEIFTTAFERGLSKEISISVIDLNSWNQACLTTNSAYKNIFKDNCISETLVSAYYYCDILCFEGIGSDEWWRRSIGKIRSDSPQRCLDLLQSRYNVPDRVIAYINSGALSFLESSDLRQLAFLLN